MTTLQEVYCRPKTEAEWEMIYPNASWLGLYPSKESHVYFDGAGKYLASGPNENPNRNEISVQHFLDLLNDSIVPWRLLEDEFDEDEDFFVRIINGWTLSVDKEYMCVWLFEFDRGNSLYVYTYTELMQVVKFLTPRNK